MKGAPFGAPFVFSAGCRIAQIRSDHHLKRAASFAGSHPPPADAGGRRRGGLRRV